MCNKGAWLGAAKFFRQVEGSLIGAEMMKEVEGRGRESCCAFCAGRSTRPWDAERVIGQIS